MKYFDTRGKLVLFSLALYLLYFYMPYIYENIYDTEVLNSLFSSPVEPVIALSGTVSWMLLVLHCIAAILLFFRLLYAKYFYLCMVSLSVILASLGGTVTYSGFDVLILALLNMSDGVIIYLSFFHIDK